MWQVWGVSVLTASLGWNHGLGWLPAQLNFGRLDLFFCSLAGAARWDVHAGLVHQSCNDQSAAESVDTDCISAHTPGRERVLCLHAVAWYVQSRVTPEECATSSAGHI